MVLLSKKQKLKIEAFKKTIGVWHLEIINSQQEKYFKKIILDSMLTEIDAILTDVEEFVLEILIEDPEIEFALLCLCNYRKIIKKEEKM